jgi:hypothetical protein
LQATLDLTGWPRIVRAPQLLLTARCPVCDKMHTRPWKLNYKADHIVHIKRCKAAAVVYLQLDVEARAELPRFLKRLQACQVSWREWKTRSAKMKAKPRAVQRSQFRTYGDRDVRDTRDDTG